MNERGFHVLYKRDYINDSKKFDASASDSTGFLCDIYFLYIQLENETI